jgi:uncharacterized protein (TIGR02246 family)
MRIALAVFVAAVLVNGCSPSPRPADLAREERTIRELAARWQKALLDRDAATQASMFADDGLEYHANQEPLAGPAAILVWEQKAAANHPKAVITSKTNEIRIAASGDLAVQSGEGRITSMGATGEDHSVRTQRFVTVWRKVNGQWKVAHDIAVDTSPWSQ